MAQSFRIDLTEIEGEREFPCPTCGEMISPDDESDIVYDILEIGTGEDGDLREIIIQCEKCGSTIHITGFGLLEELGYSDE